LYPGKYNRTQQVCEDIKQLIKERTAVKEPNAVCVICGALADQYIMGDPVCADHAPKIEIVPQQIVLKPLKMVAIEQYLQAFPTQLTFADYQRRTAETAVYPNVGKNPIYPTLGLCGEAGEVAEKVKKVLRDKGGVFDDEARAAIGKEISDVLWYAARLADELGLDLGELAAGNLAKLADRKARGVIKGDGDTR
jgi:NTP pyrophosphatase (non-canonical NTP hydrolase)